MKKGLFLLIILSVLVSSVIAVAAPPVIESELVLITPVTKFIVDGAAEKFKAYSKKHYGIEVTVNATYSGTPVCFGKITEWAGRPQADIFWGGESALFDKLAQQNLLMKLDIDQDVIESVPDAIGEPKQVPLKDPNNFWIGTTLEPYGISYNPKLLKRLGVAPIKTWNDLLNPKLKGWVAQCTPDRSSSNHASYEVIFQSMGLKNGWIWAEKLAKNTPHFAARSRDVPSLVAKGEAAVGFAVPSYMQFEEVMAGYDVQFVAPKNSFVTCEPIAVLSGAKNAKAAQAFIEFLHTEQGQKVFMERGLFPITPKYRVAGSPSSIAEKAVKFTGVRSFFDAPVSNIYDDDVAQKRYNEINDTFRKRILEQHENLIKQKK